jgi:hypothetical protein
MLHVIELRALKGLRAKVDSKLGFAIHADSLSIAHLHFNITVTMRDTYPRHADTQHIHM